VLLRALRRPTNLLALGGLVLAGFLYWKPIGAYMHTKQILQQRQAEVVRLQTQNASLKTRIDEAGTGDALVREARRLGLVKPGERLFIVRGIQAWRAKHRQAG
jgi:cell division protein FtsB